MAPALVSQIIRDITCVLNYGKSVMLKLYKGWRSPTSSEIPEGNQHRERIDNGSDDEHPVLYAVFNDDSVCWIVNRKRPRCYRGVSHEWSITKLFLVRSFSQGLTEAEDANAYLGVCVAPNSQESVRLSGVESAGGHHRAVGGRLRACMTAEDYRS
ncbi:hypothetical protein BKA93DRAFT_841844 [Sparassis latifolia]